MGVLGTFRQFKKQFKLVAKQQFETNYTVWYYKHKFLNWSFMVTKDCGSITYELFRPRRKQCVVVYDNKREAKAHAISELYNYYALADVILR